MNLQAVGNLQFPLGDQTVSQSLSCVPTYTAQSLGTIDIPSGTASGVAFQIPFGSVANAKGYYIKAGADVKLAWNGATGAPVPVASGGFHMAAMPGNVSGTALSSGVLVTVATADGLKTITYGIFGD